MSVVWRFVITVIAFLAAVCLAAWALESFLGRSYPAWTIFAALVLVSPVVIWLWRERMK